MKVYKISLTERIERLIWNIIYLITFRYSPNVFFKYRVLILKLFGSKIHWNSRVYPKVEIYRPKNLIIGENSTIANSVHIYNVAPIIIGNNSVISNKSALITASKNYKGKRELLIDKIYIGDNVWIAYDVFIAPGVKIADDSKILARVSLFKSIEEKKVVKYGQNL